MVITGKLESPAFDATFNRILTIEGWAVSIEKPVQIDIVVDKTKIDTIDVGMPRFDIYEKYHHEEFYESGFFYHILRGKLLRCGINLKKDQCDLEVIAKSQTERKKIGSIKLIIKQDVSKIPKPETFYNKFSKGQLFLPHLIELGKLKPSHTVLDVGCGIGRVAITLTKFLSEAGGYYGFDIVPSAIKRCQKHITPKYPNFYFDFAEVKNNYYNKAGNIDGRNYRFPYDDNFFDLVFLQSVFTHLLPDEIRNYLKEIKRVLKKGRRCIITYYIINRTSKEAIRNKALPPSYRFEHNFGVYYSAFKDKPEASIAYDESFIQNLYEELGFRIETIKYGNWCRKDVSAYYSDIIVSVK